MIRVDDKIEIVKTSQDTIFNQNQQHEDNHKQRAPKALGLAKTAANYIPT